MKLATCLFLVFAILACSSLAMAAEYRYSRVYTYQGSQDDIMVALGAAINDHGLVAIADFNIGIVTTDGRTTTMIATDGSTAGLPKCYPAYQAVSLNNSGFVAFRGSVWDNIQGRVEVEKCRVLASDGTTTKVIASQAEYPVPGLVGSLGDSPLSINDSGMVAFQAARISDPDYSILVGDGTAAPVLVNSSFGIAPAMNNSGRIAYLWGPAGDGHPTGGIRIQDGTTVLALPGDDPFRPDINDLGTVACIAAFSGATKIVVGDGVSPPTYIDGSLYKGGFGSSCEGRNWGGCAINDQGLVAFFAYAEHSPMSPFNVSPGIFTRADPLTDKVIMAGDLLDGLTVRNVGFSSNGLNDSGQIAFTAVLSDGTQGVWIATPVPEPSTFILLAIGAIGLLFWAKRM